MNQDQDRRSIEFDLAKYERDGYAAIEAAKKAPRLHTLAKEIDEIFDRIADTPGWFYPEMWKSIGEVATRHKKTFEDEVTQARLFRPYASRAVSDEMLPLICAATGIETCAHICESLHRALLKIPMSEEEATTPFPLGGYAELYCGSKEGD